MKYRSLISFAVGASLAASPLEATGVFAPRLLPLPDHPSHVAVADVTGDGRNDVVLGMSFCRPDCDLLVLPQTASGTLGTPARYPAQEAMSLAAGDLNGDGRSDVLVGGGFFLDFYFQSATGTLSAGLGAGSFHPAMSIAAGDLNRDGRPDLAALRHVAEAPSPLVFDLYPQSPSGEFTGSMYSLDALDSCSFCAVEIADLDGDRRPDVYLVDDMARLQVLYQEPGGHFVHEMIDQDDLGIHFWRVEPGNFDTDPKPELFVLGGFVDPPSPFSLAILDQVGPRRWSLREIVPLTVGLQRHAVADLDGDGRTDFVGITYPVLDTQQARIYLQDSEGKLVLSQQIDLPYGNYFTGDPLIIADLNHDSLPDVAIASDNFGLIALVQQSDRPDVPAPELFPAEIPDFGFTVRISSGSSSIAGSLESSCIPETACVSGAVQYRSEVFLRVVGPKGNGKLWPTIVKFTTSRVDVWVHQISTGEVRHYRLAGAAPGTDELPGLFDRDGFVPTPLSGAAALEPSGGQIPPPPSRIIDWERWRDFRFRAQISSGGTTQRVRREIGCIDETLCLSGAIPGRSEVFVRLVGPKGNGRLWPTIVKFTTSTVEVWIEQISTGEKRYYRLEGARPGEDELNGLFDRNGFVP